jgi:hypothetical protein
VTPQRLVDVEGTARRRRSRALVPVTGCPHCGGPLEAVTSAMPALFRHGGHGATRTVTRRFCAPCRIRAMGSLFGPGAGRYDGDDVRQYDLPLGGQATVSGKLGELAGKDLACWCPLDQPCHADVLLALANVDVDGRL